MADTFLGEKIIRRRRQLLFERLLAILVLIVIASVLFIYFSVYTKTSSYVTKEVVTAIEKRDIKTLKKYADMNSIVTKIYDDLTSKLLEYDTQLSEYEQSFYGNFYVMVRSQICQGFVDSINVYLSTGKWIIPSKILEGRQLGIDYDILLERSLINHTSFTRVEKIEERNDEIIIYVSVVEDYTRVPFVLQISLKEVFEGDSGNNSQSINFFGKEIQLPQFGDKNWSIVSIINYKEYLDTITPIINQNITKYVQDTNYVISHYNKIFYDEQNDFRILQKSASGILTNNQCNEIVSYILNVIIPSLEDRQKELDQVAIPPAAQFLAELRRSSTQTNIEAWNAYARGLQENDATELNLAENFLQQSTVMDQKIADIINNTAYAEKIPELQ